MADPQSVISSNRLAVNAFVEAARSLSPAQWTAPRAPGKWSPAQVTEHVALTYEQSRRMLLGTFTGTAIPWYQQLMARWIGLRMLFKRGGFGNKPLVGPDFIQPTTSPASSAELLTRLEVISHDLEVDLAGAPGTGRVTLNHPIFGRMSLEDLLHFLAIHTNHHRPQLSAGTV